MKVFFEAFTGLSQAFKGLFNAFDPDGSGHISFRELHKMLRQKAPSPDGVNRHVSFTDGLVNGVADMATLRVQARQQALLMSVQAEMHHQTVSGDDAAAGSPTADDVLMGKAAPPKLGTLPRGLSVNVRQAMETAAPSDGAGDAVLQAAMEMAVEEDYADEEWADDNE